MFEIDLSCFKLTTLFWNIMKQFQTNLWQSILHMTVLRWCDAVVYSECRRFLLRLPFHAQKKTLRGNWKVMFTHIWLSQPVQLWETARGFFVQQHWTLLLQVILFEIDCTIFYTIFFCQFITWTNWVNPGKFMDNCWLSCQAMAKFMTIS